MVAVERPGWWPSDPVTERRVIDAMGPLRLRWCPWIPTVKQEAALRIFGNELFYGGAAGGGKSVWMLMAAAQFVDVPGYRALILRRTYGELSQPGGLIEMSHQWWDGTGAVWSQSGRRWTFPSGAQVEFGHMATALAYARYQGGGYHFVGFEELTHFLEEQYAYLHSRTRRVAEDEWTIEHRGRLEASPDGLTAATIPVRVRSTGNPGGIGHEWVKIRLVDPATRYVDPDTGERAVFVAAKLTDNDYLDQAAYVKSLAHLDPVTRKQLLDGDWTVVPGGTLIMAGAFGYLERQTTPIARAARAWDLASTPVIPGVSPDPDWTVGVRMHAIKDGSFEIVDVEALRDEPSKVEERIKDTARLDGRRLPIGIPQDPGQAGVSQLDHYRRHVLRGYDVRAMRPSKDKETRARPFASAANGGLVAVLRRPWTPQAVREWTGFPFTGHDDHIDAASDVHALVSSSGPIRVQKARGRVPVSRKRPT